MHIYLSGDPLARATILRSLFPKFIGTEEIPNLFRKLLEGDDKMPGVYEVVYWIREQDLPDLYPEFLEKIAISLEGGYNKAKTNLVPETGDKDIRAKLVMTAILDKMQENNLSQEEAKLVVRKMNKIAIVDFDYQSEFP